MVLCYSLCCWDQWDDLKSYKEASHDSSARTIHFMLALRVDAKNGHFNAGRLNGGYFTSTRGLK